MASSSQGHLISRREPTVARPLIPKRTRPSGRKAGHIWGRRLRLAGSVTVSHEPSNTARRWSLTVSGSWGTRISTPWPPVATWRAYQEAGRLAKAESLRNDTERGS